MWTRLILRIVTAAGVLLSAWVHYKLWHEGFRDLHVVGPAFLLNAVGGLVIGALLLAWWHWIPPLLAVGFGLSTLSTSTWTSTPSTATPSRSRKTSGATTATSARPC